MDIVGQGVLGTTGSKGSQGPPGDKGAVGEKGEQVSDLLNPKWAVSVSASSCRM